MLGHQQAQQLLHSYTSCMVLKFLQLLTHLPLNKVAAISQMALSNTFSWMKMLEFRLKFHWNLVLRVQLTIIEHWFTWWLGAVRATSHYLNQWTNADLFHRRVRNSGEMSFNDFEYAVANQTIPFKMVDEISQNIAVLRVLTQPSLKQYGGDPANDKYGVFCLFEFEQKGWRKRFYDG